MATIKKTILTSFIISTNILSLSAQQWNGSLDVAGNLWRYGNVGIGTSNPLTKLMIGNYSEQNTLRITGGETINKAPVLSFYRSGIRESFIAQVGQNLVFANTTGLANYSDAEMTNDANMVIDNSGNVGIGTTNPTLAKLQIQGNIWVGSPSIGYNVHENSKVVVFGTAQSETSVGFWQAGVASSKIGSLPGDPNFYLTNSYDGSGLGSASRSISLTTNGSVGIGTNSPSKKLTVIGGSEVISYFEASTSGYAALSFSGNGGNTKAVLTTYNGLVYFGRMNIGGTGSEADIIITSNGNILIGKTTQTNYKLDVAGSIRANEVVVNSAGADFVFANDYKLPCLFEVEKFIKENNHLPGMAHAP